MTAYEFEVLPELAPAHEASFEWGESLGEDESEAELARLVSGLKSVHRGIVDWGERNPGKRSQVRHALQGVAGAGGAALGTLLGQRVGHPGSVGAATGIAAGGAAKAFSDWLFGQKASEYESEFELNPVRRVYPDAALEHLGHMAAESESEDEAAESFLPLIPLLAAKALPLAAKALPIAMKLGAKLAPKVGNFLLKNAPRITRAVGNLARNLYRSPATRQFLRTIPTMARRTAADVARAFARGKRINGRWVLRRFAGQAARVLRQPDQAQAVLRRAGGIDRTLHGAGGLVPAPAYAVSAGAPAGLCSRCSAGM